ncbi:MAG: type II secretion system F family protein [Planctomycetota bacterium]|nr:type II secretion system F family protein [Planctomycetota bacterium]
MTSLTFHYTALDRAGSTRGGSVPAATRQEAIRKIAALGLTPVSLREGADRGSGRRGRVAARELAHFTYQLAVLVSARISISDGLMSIAKQERDPGFRAVISDLAARVESGEPLVTAMRAHESVFGPVFIETVHAAEKSGNLVKVLENLSELLEQSAETTRLVRGSFIYPACVSSVLAGAVVFLIGFVVPKFATMFESRGLELPVLTRVLVDVGRSMQSFWFVWLALAAVGAFAVRSGRGPFSRSVVERVAGRMPVIGAILSGVAQSRFAYVLGVTLSAGLTLIECLELAGRAAGTAAMRSDVRVLIEQVRQGGKLCDALTRCTAFSPFAQRMLAAGEEAAELPRMCGIIAAHYDRETRHMVKNLSVVIEPVLIVLITGIVLVVALAIFLPMWDMVKVVG